MLPYLANGAVKEFSFVKAASAPGGAPRSETKYVSQAGAGDAVFGVSGQGGALARPAGTSPDGVQVATEGERAVVVISPTAGRAVLKGEYLKAAADGYAVPATFPTVENSGTDKIGARVIESAAPGNHCTVEVCSILPPA